MKRILINNNDGNSIINSNSFLPALIKKIVKIYLTKFMFA